MSFYKKLKLSSVFVTLALLAAIVQAGSYDDFFFAIEKNDVHGVSSFLNRGFDPNTPTEDGLTPLIVAIRAGSINVALILANTKGVDLDRPNLHDETPLMLAIISGNKEFAKYLISIGASVNKPGWTPLHYASTKGDLSTMRLLLNESAYIDSESPNGTTPLMMAAQYGTIDAVKLLIEEGADPTIKNNLKLNAIQFAEIGGNPIVINYLKTQNSIWILSHP